MKISYTLLFLLSFGIFSNTLFAQNGQIEISRVNQMPDLPSPYEMRNWKEVAVKYDEFIYSLDKTGEYLPLIGLKANGTNYSTLQPILLQTYVGSNSANQAEAINIIPSLVGATLNGVDKSNQNGINWVEKAKDFYNSKNGQNVYLNGYNVQSGKDWWYDVMPNVFFYQLYTQYPAVPDFEIQFTTIADRWLEAVYKMGGSSKPWSVPQMNHRAWNLATMTPLNEGTKEPESAGTISWLLYNAFLKTGDKKYLHGAEMSMEFLSSLNSNPSYELQLPYGVLNAARMNAREGTKYDIDKMINWCFDRGGLRGWGAIVGNWNGQDVSGIIGEANDQGNDYAFLMNGYQQAAALVPLTKYDKRYARAISKWVLNLSNASRLFYSKYLPSENQDDYAWSIQHDPESVIAYEALKENIDGKSLYGTGDAKRGGWAATNLGLYGSSHVGYLAAIVDTTDVAGILQLDLNKTDFFGENAFPSYLIYNPHVDSKQVTLKLGNNAYDIYDAISETMIGTSVSGNHPVQINAGEVKLLVYLPANSSTAELDGKLYLGEEVIDYHYGYNFQGKLRIKSLDVDTNVVGFNKVIPIYTKVDNAMTPISYRWIVNGFLTATTTEEIYNWTVPAIEGEYNVVLEAVADSDTARDSISLTVMERVPAKPDVINLKTDKKFYMIGETAIIICGVNNEDKDTLEYLWTVNEGTFSEQDSLMQYVLPGQPGVYKVSINVKNQFDLETTATTEILVKEPSEDNEKVLAYYPLNGDVKDYSGNNYDAILEGAQSASDSRDSLNSAYKFSSGTDIIYVPNNTTLNFRDEITLAFWVKVDNVDNESFIISHGSYEERWKVSITPDKKIRWTLKTDEGTKDLDSSFPIELNKFYHVTVLYTGYSLEMHINGELNSFTAHSGLMSITLQPITFGRKTKAEELYHLSGTVDEVRIYSQALDPTKIAQLKSMWEEDIVSGFEDNLNVDLLIYPNPTESQVIFIKGLESNVQKIELTDISGKPVNFTYVKQKDVIRINLKKGSSNVLLLKIKTDRETFMRKVINSSTH
ncbi:MAG TPA: LamG-like jellyroll fold domain-containing protein [Cytophagales bacterium]|nr:LamG-like jellyroll fold domain-containing protein [Cytophagales bacterium]